MKKLTLFAVSMVLTCGQSFANENLIQNGSFEDVNFSNAIYTDNITWATFGDGDTVSLPGWTTLDSGVEWVQADGPYSGGSGATPLGSASIDLNNYTSTNGGGIEQEINTTIGQIYRVEFYIGTMQSHGRSGLGVIDVFIGDENYTFRTNTLSSTLEWVPISFEYKATESATTLKFMTSTDSYEHFAAIDGVSITAVP